MKYTYRFANGDVNEIEVTEDQAFTLADLDRLEYNNDHANTRRQPQHAQRDKARGVERWADALRQQSQRAHRL